MSQMKACSTNAQKIVICCIVSSSWCPGATWHKYLDAYVSNHHRGQYNSSISVATHSVNPIKLIIQVLNYTRKHNYPVRRSAFTYLDEEQPTRMDYGKEKFGGPFTEEEVEDVKTILRLLPLMACISFSVKGADATLSLNVSDNQYINCVLNYGAEFWLAPLLIIPFLRCLLYPLLHNRIPSMLKRIGTGLLLHLVGYTLCAATLFEEYTHGGDAGIASRYLACSPPNTTQNAANEYFVQWYWKLPPLMLFSVSRAVVNVLLLEFSVAQSPDKMRGLVIGLEVASVGIGGCFSSLLYYLVPYTLCYDVPTILLPAVLFVVFLVLSNEQVMWQASERNSEWINITQL